MSLNPVPKLSCCSIKKLFSIFHELTLEKGFKPEVRIFNESLENRKRCIP